MSVGFGQWAVGRDEQRRRETTIKLEEGDRVWYDHLMQSAIDQTMVTTELFEMMPATNRYDS